ncbi:hypothetical protein G7046_g2745 [Stylonectria norvegica]|nr:hypothetical protein G7046_g2745 [Stylonectria norvegica]
MLLPARHARLQAHLKPASDLAKTRRRVDPRRADQSRSEMPDTVPSSSLRFGNLEDGGFLLAFAHPGGVINTIRSQQMSCFAPAAAQQQASSRPVPTVFATEVPICINKCIYMHRKL